MCMADRRCLHAYISVSAAAFVLLDMIPAGGRPASMQGGPLDRQQHVVDSHSQPLTQPPRFCVERPACSRQAHKRAAVHEQQLCQRCRARDGIGSNLACLGDGRVIVKRRVQPCKHTELTACGRR